MEFSGTHSTTNLIKVIEFIVFKFECQTLLLASIRSPQLELWHKQNGWQTPVPIFLQNWINNLHYLSKEYIIWARLSENVSYAICEQ